MNWIQEEIKSLKEQLQNQEPVAFGDFTLSYNKQYDAYIIEEGSTKIFRIYYGGSIFIMYRHFSTADRLREIMQKLLDIMDSTTYKKILSTKEKIGNLETLLDEIQTKARPKLVKVIETNPAKLIGLQFSYHEKPYTIKNITAKYIICEQGRIAIDTGFELMLREEQILFHLEKEL